VLEGVGGSNGRHGSPRSFGTGCHIVQRKVVDRKIGTGCGRMIRGSRFEIRDQDVLVSPAGRGLFLLKLACSSRDASVLRLVGDGLEVLGSSCEACESRLGRDGLGGRVVIWGSRVVIWDRDA
jgi:hypothetical protein